MPPRGFEPKSPVSMAIELLTTPFIPMSFWGGINFYGPMIYTYP